MNTIDFTPKAAGTFYTIAELNALFTAIAAVLADKIDLRGDTLVGDLVLVDSSIINVPEPEAPGDLLRTPA